MGFSQEQGYVPLTIEDLMEFVMDNVNTQFGTSFTAETFIGTNFYKFYYALIQRLQESEIKTSEIFLKLQQYIAITNERISRPVATNPGIVEKLVSEGYRAAVKPPIDADAGKVYICVDKVMEDASHWEDSAGYAADKLEVNTIIKDSIAAGIVSQGAQSSTIVLSNGQSFAFKYTLPTRTRTYLKLTVTLSVNNQVVIDTPEVQKQRLLDNIEERYALGMAFEPQKYFDLDDAPWASSVLLEHSTDNSTWVSTIIANAYNELVTVALADITLVEN